MTPAEAKAAAAGEQAITFHAVALAAAIVLADEVERLEQECDELRAELDRVRDDYHAQLETVHELNEALAAVLPDLQRAMSDRPRLGRLP